MPSPYFDLSKVPTQQVIDDETTDPAAAVIAAGARHVRIKKWREGLLEMLIPAASAIERITIEKGVANLSNLGRFAGLRHLTMRDGADTSDFANLPALEAQFQAVMPCQGTTHPTCLYSMLSPTISRPSMT